MKTMKFWRATLVTMLVLAVLLSVTGGTIAWFTDQVTSTNNIVKSGELKVDLQWKKPGEDTWKDASAGAIFDYQLWEPGYTDVKAVKISNTGNLAFKYQLTIKPSVTADSTADANLADVIDVYMFEDAPTRETIAAAQPVGTISSLVGDPNGAAYGVLLPEEGSANFTKPTDEKELKLISEGSKEVFIALKMQESAGNEYQNLSVGNGFILELMATQYTYENDSFGHTYDQGATYDEVPQAIVVVNGKKSIEVNGETFTLDNSYYFKAPSTVEEAQQSRYRYWHADYVVSFDKPVSANSLALAGHYKAYNDDNWVVVPLPQMPAKEPTRILKSAESVTGKPIYVNYEEACDWVQELECGVIAFNPEELNGTTMNVELRLYEVEQPSAENHNSKNIEVVPENYVVIGTYSHTFTLDDGVGDLPALPEATVQDLDTKTVTIKDTNDSIQLEQAYGFNTTETAEEAAASPYAKWHADFVVKFDTTIPANTVTLAGQYDRYSEDWVAVTLDKAISAGSENRLLASAKDNDGKPIYINYEEICQFVESFQCGAVGTEEVNGTTITVELRLYEVEQPSADNGNSWNVETGNYVTAGWFSYTFQ